MGGSAHAADRACASDREGAGTNAASRAGAAKDHTITASGWVVPKTDPYQKPDGTTCRDVTQSVSKHGQTQSQDVTICRTQVAQADGSNWVIPQ